VYDRPPMRRLNRLAALCVGVLLLAAPAAWACGELGAMTSQCPMPEMTESMGTSMCHDDGQMSEDCCDLTSAPEPMQASSFESAKLLTALEVTDLQVVAPPAPAVLPRHSTSADAFRPPDLGRYTLFSSFLL
jgi:hypothetical protein